MNLVDAKTLCRKQMREHGLFEQGWTFAFDNAKRRFGATHWRTKQITVSQHVALLNPKEDVLDTILHEIAHVLAGPRNGHNYLWKAHARAIGASPERCAPAETKTPPAKWIAYCPNGHQHLVHRRKVRSTSSCGRCSNVYNPDYIIKYKLNEGVA